MRWQRRADEPVIVTSCTQRNSLSVPGEISESKKNRPRTRRSISQEIPLPVDFQADPTPPNPPGFQYSPLSLLRVIVHPHIHQQLPKARTNHIPQKFTVGSPIASRRRRNKLLGHLQESKKAQGPISRLVRRNRSLFSSTGGVRPVLVILTQKSGLLLGGGWWEGIHTNVQGSMSAPAVFVALCWRGGKGRHWQAFASPLPSHPSHFFRADFSLRSKRGAPGVLR